MARVIVVDSRPSEVRLLAYGGDPFDLTVRLRSAGAPADVSTWEWSGQVRLPDEVLDFHTSNLVDGVELTMPGTDTEAIAVAGVRYWRFELVGRDPGSSEGRTILSGWMLAESRLKPPPAPPWSRREAEVVS